MVLPRPKLDDRTFQDLVDEAKRKISEKCPQWTDHNVSDPGIALIEIFAWMTDLLIYRINQVPEKNYIALLNLLGIQREPPRPARGSIVFKFVMPHPPLILPKGIQAATKRDGASGEIVFTTVEDAHVKDIQEQVTVPITQTALIQNEELTLGDSPPLRLSHNPIVAPAEGEIIEIQMEGNNWEPWTPIIIGAPVQPDHALKSYFLDPVSGEVSFPCNAPPAGKAIRMRAYRVTRGAIGNVGAHQISVTKSEIPYVDSVFNSEPCAGGRDEQTLEDAKRAAASLLQARDRVVTAKDFEDFTKTVTGVGLVRCSPGDTPMSVNLYVIPSEPDMKQNPAHLDDYCETLRRATIWGQDVDINTLKGWFKLAPLVSEIRSVLEPRVLLPVTPDKISIELPKLGFAAISVIIVPSLDMTQEQRADLKLEVEKKLCLWLHPLQGNDGANATGSGWEFGQVLYQEAFYPMLLAIPGIKEIKELLLNQVIEKASGEHALVPQTRIDPGENGKIAAAFSLVQIDPRV